VCRGAARLSHTPLGYRHGIALTCLYLLLAVSAGSVLAWLLAGRLDFSYDKILSRGVLLFAALGLIPLGRAARLTAAGIGLRPLHWRGMLYAYPLGVLLLLPLILVYMVTGFRVLDDRVVYLGPEFLGFVFGALASSLLVGLFEETLFRGVMFSALRRSAGFVASAALVGVVYAAVHFLDAEPVASPEVHWYTGFTQVFAAFQQMLDLGGHWDSFVALFLLGVLFCWIREHVGLWWCIGLHAAWVFGIRVFKEMTVRDVVNPYQGLVGSYDNFVGHLVSVWLLFIFVVLALYRTARPQLPSAGTVSGG